MGRTLPPLFRTVRRVCRILLTRWTSGRILLKVGLLQNSVKVQKRTFLQISVKTFFLFYRFLRNKVAGLALSLIWDISPLSVCGFLLMCCFWPIKGLRWLNSIEARPPCQTGGRRVYSTYKYLRYLSTKNRARAKRQKSLVYQRFSAFLPSVFRPFSMYKNCPHNVQVLPPMMYKDCPLNVQTLPPL